MSKTLTGIRPSLWARCPTAAVFQGRGEPEADVPAEVEEYFFRGHVFEEIVVRQIEAKHGVENVQRQVVIPIPGIGEGHADAYLIPEKALVEVKSTTSPYPNSDTFSFGVAQLRIYLAFHPEAEKGFLYMLNPNTMRPADVYEVRLDEGDRVEILAQAAWISIQLEDNAPSLPNHGDEWRPCTRPSQARSHMCPFAAVCFDGWEEPAAVTIDDPDVLEVVARLALIIEQEKPHKEAIAALDEGKRQTKADLAEYLPDRGEVVVGPYLVKTWPVGGKVTVQRNALEAAGIDPSPFITVGEGRQEIRLSKADVPGDIDYGSVPF